jgi:thiaminase/transcriptional activator TenA
MRFVREAVAGTLPDEVFARYLVIERDFVDVACRSLGAAILRAPSPLALRGHFRTLTTFLADQDRYFEDAMADSPPDGVAGPRARAQAAALGRRVLEVCDGGAYAEVVACMLPSECLYEAWCGEAARRPAPRSPRLEAWIAEHAGPPYTDTVAFLRGEVDGLAVDGETAGRLTAIVAEILELERAMHDAAYLTD